MFVPIVATLVYHQTGVVLLPLQTDLVSSRYCIRDFFQQQTIFPGTLTKRGHSLDRGIDSPSLLPSQSNNDGSNMFAMLSSSSVMMANWRTAVLWRPPPNTGWWKTHTRVRTVVVGVEKSHLSNITFGPTLYVCRAGLLLPPPLLYDRIGRGGGGGGETTKGRSSRVRLPTMAVGCCSREEKMIVC